MKHSELMAALRGALGAEQVLDDDTTRRYFSHDLFWSGKPPACVVVPRNVQDVATAVRLATAAGHPVVIYDVPLLVESRLHEAMAGVIVVAVPREVQLQRLMARDGIDLAAAEARLAAQLPLEAKLKVADYVIDNAGSVEDTRRQTAVVWQDILAGGPRRPRGQGGAS